MKTVTKAQQWGIRCAMVQLIRERGPQLEGVTPEKVCAMADISPSERNYAAVLARAAENIHVARTVRPNLFD